MIHRLSLFTLSILISTSFLCLLVILLQQSNGFLTKNDLNNRQQRLYYNHHAADPYSSSFVLTKWEKISDFGTNNLERKNQEIDGAPKYQFLHQEGLQPIRRLPDSLIIGVRKGGTRALLEFIRLHPDVRAAGSEIHFFDAHYSKGFHWYRQRMPPTINGQITMEKTPSYFVNRVVPQRVYQMNPSIKLLVVLRDPVTRAVSDYAQVISKNVTLPKFEELAFHNGSQFGLVDTSWIPIRIGVYVRHLEQWLHYFPLSQFHFVSGERLISDPAAEIAQVQDFLGLKRIISEKHFYFNATKGFPCLKKSEGHSSPHCLGKTKGRNHPTIDPAVIERLHEFYRPFNARLYQITGINFGWS